MNQNNFSIDPYNKNLNATNNDIDKHSFERDG